MTEAGATGRIVGVRESLVRVALDGQHVRRNELGYVEVGDARLMAEVLRIRGDLADMQVFEDTRGIRVGDSVQFSGALLSAGWAFLVCRCALASHPR